MAAPFDISIPDRSIPFVCRRCVASSLGMAVSLYRVLTHRSCTMPIVNRTTATVERLAQAAAHLRQAMSLIEEVAPETVGCLALGAASPSPQSTLSHDRSVTPPGNGTAPPSMVDETTFRVRWANRTCRLGNTYPFWLLERLARRPNQFVSYEVLFRDVWDDDYTSAEAVRSAVKTLRRKLNAAGMEDLAEAIDGSNSRHYALRLVKRD